MHLLISNVFLWLFELFNAYLLQATFGSMASQMREHLKEEEDTGLANTCHSCCIHAHTPCNTNSKTVSVLLTCVPKVCL